MPINQVWSGSAIVPTASLELRSQPSGGDMEDLMSGRLDMQGSF